MLVNAFLKTVLGADGAEALAKVALKVPNIQNVILPQTVTAWLNGVDVYEGVIPGTENTYLKFVKTQNDTFAGFVTIQDQIYEFSKASPKHLAASIMVSLGTDTADLPTIKKSELERLNKSLELLVKAQKELASIKKGVKAPVSPDPLDAPNAPTPAEKQPPAETPAAPKLPKIKLAPIKLKLSEIMAVCPECGTKQFSAGELKGCFCVRDLVKDAEIEYALDSVTVKFVDPDVGIEEASFLVETLEGQYE